MNTISLSSATTPQKAESPIPDKGNGKAPSHLDEQIIDISKEPPPVQKLALTTSDQWLTASHALQWGLIGASFYGVAPATIASIGTLTTLGAEIATYTLLPQNKSWLRTILTFPFFSKKILDYAPPIIQQVSHTYSFYILAKNCLSKLAEVWKKWKLDRNHALKIGTVHLFNLISGTAFAAERAGLIQLTAKTIEPSKEKEPPTPAKTKRKEIRLATVYSNNGDQRRQAISDLATENHKKYAAHWNLKHDLVSQSLVEGQCTNPLSKETANCSPYWNKIKYFKNWCAQPATTDGEEWSIYADDDAIYTNFQIDPSIAIDQLRDAKDSSFIIATEGTGTRYNPGAVNTGVMIVRKDTKGCGIIDKIWANRNSITSTNPECPTFGMCKGQKNGDEQGATDKVLWVDDPKATETTVTRVLSRDPTHPTRGNIAFNTLHRGGCFKAQLPDGTLGGPFNILTHDLSTNPDGIWHEGDWIGQTGGYPLYGQDLSHQPPNDCKDDPSTPIEAIRLKKVKQMVDAADKTALIHRNSQNKPREITFGAVYDNSGDPNRNQISDFVNENHKKYADQWGIKHQVISKGLVSGKCLNPQNRQPADCAPFWNKIQMYREWLNEPKNRAVGEEWRYYADDDMLVMNRSIDPSKAIDQLRGGKDTSVIVAEDVINWQRWFFKDYNPRLSVNTGALIVRKDEQARNLIEAIWNLRNLPVERPTPECPTIGMCKTQDRSMHEQEAMTRVLRDNPNLVDTAVTIVSPRDTSSSSRSHLAMNTFYRKGCFARILKGWSPQAFSYEGMDSAENPSGAFQTGDWLVQVAGVPVLGKNLPLTGGACIDRYEIPESPVRLNKLKELSKQIIG